jgi:hypothetical protein
LRQISAGKLARHGVTEWNLHHDQDHVVLLDLGIADDAKPRVVSLRKNFAPVEGEPVIV